MKSYRIVYRRDNGDRSYHETGLSFEDAVVLYTQCLSHKPQNRSAYWIEEEEEETRRADN